MNPYSDFIDIVKIHGYNKDVDVLLGTVTSPQPDLKIKVDNLPLELIEEDLIIAQHLTKYQIPFTANIKKAKFESAPFGTLDSNYVDINGDYAQQKGSYHSLSFIFDEGFITLNNSLKVGDRVILAEFEEGQTYVVLDRTVRL